ncbi:MAG: rubredoxin-like domain-containing protein [Bacillota bacterium]
MEWKCDNCGYTFKSEPDKLPEKCPSCNEKCVFLNITCYTPDCGCPSPSPGGFDADFRIGKK